MAVVTRKAEALYSVYYELKREESPFLPEFGEFKEAFIEWKTNDEK